jgi:putative peptide zinc metalloprotease protein
MVEAVMDGEESGSLEAQSPGVQPEIRQDLNLYPAGADPQGNAIWHLHDPLANKFYQMQERDIELLALVGQKSAAEISASANSLRRLPVDVDEVEHLLKFLRDNNLVRGDDLQQALYNSTLQYSRQKSWWEMAARNPLFFRIPVSKPDRFLDASLPYVEWMGSRFTGIALVVIGILAFVMVVRQIDQFFATFLHFFSWSGLLIYLLTLFFIKVFHELGHAYTAKSMGCRVPVIGVAFMVGWPILYTDTSDAWKVPDRIKRLQIGAAGVGVELGIAVLALFLWSVTPEGSLRSAFFLLATTTWVLSVLVNFNPLMKFDGYYLLSDLSNTPNLEPRSFAMAKWWLREKLFGLGLEPAEEPRRWMVIFAFSVWVYRFLLFLGIALLVYNFFFKAVGIIMFVVELVYFIGRPIYNEIKQWWGFRDQIKFNAAVKRSLMIIGVAGLLLFVPWYSDVTAQATLSGKSTDVYLPVPGRLVSTSERQEVKAGDLLFQFESPELELGIQEVRNRYEELNWIRSSQGFDIKLRSEALIVESELRTQNQRLRSLVAEQQRLSIRAPFDGTLVDVATDVMLQDWLPAGHKIASIVDRTNITVTAYLPENQLARIETGMTARFFPDNLEHGVYDLLVTEIQFMGSPELDSLYVASTFGGNIAVRESKAGELLTVESHYKIKLKPVDPDVNVTQVVRGVAVIDGFSESLFNRIRKRFVAVFIRETGF